MKLKNLILALLASVAVAFSLASCGGDEHHDHDGHDHGGGDGNEQAAAPAADDGYPLKTCVVSGEELGSMGDPVLVKHGDVTVKLCCKSCIEDFEAEPDKFVALLKPKS